MSAPAQKLGAGETARESINAELGRERGEYDGAGHGGLRIRVLQPVVQQRQRALDADRGEHQRAARALQTDAAERKRAAGIHVERGAGKEQHARAELDDDVTHAGTICPLGAARPDQQHRGDRRELPPDEQREEIAGKDRPQRRPAVDQRRDVLGRILDVQRVERREEEREDEHVAEEKAQAVDAHERERLPEQLELSELPVGQQQQPDENGRRQRQQVRCAQAPPDERHERGAQNRQQGDRDISAHSNPRVA
jgi:hypothetical protein